MSRLLGFLLFAATTALAQNTIPPRAGGLTPNTAANNPLIEFYSDKVWRASRWYVLGEWIGTASIRWLDGSRTSFSPLPASCVDSEFELVREGDTEKNLDILRTGSWVAIEVTPTIVSDTFRVQSSFTSAPECQRSFTMHYSFRGGRGGGISPALFLSPEKNQFAGREFRIRAVEPEDRADIQLDLLLGWWRAKFPDASAGGRKSMNLAPQAVVRGEWPMPFLPGAGLILNLEQTVTNVNTIKDQNSLYADWALGIFYQHIFPIKDGFQLRGIFSYRHHLSDDNDLIPTIPLVNKEAKYLVGGLAGNLYFAQRWLVGGDVYYGYPNTLAGRGVKQSFLSFYGRLGFRLTRTVMLLLEAGQQSYRATGLGTEQSIFGQTGIRLEL